jgi:salicylate hydroxylase
MARVLERAYKSLAEPGAPPAASRALHAAFEAYDEIRRPRAQRQVDTSVECGLLYNLSQPEAGDDMQKRFDWLWNHDLNEDTEKAVQRFEEIVQRSL